VVPVVLRLNLLAGMRGPPRPQPRRHRSLDEVRQLLAVAGDAVASAEDAFRRRPGSAAVSRQLFAAEQLLLLVRRGVAFYLVDQGLLLRAQARLGHRDPATTLRHYSHATPLDDTDVADQLDGLLNGLAQSTDHSE